MVTRMATRAASGEPAAAIVERLDLRQITDDRFIADLVAGVLAENPAQVASYLEGKETLVNWFFGQVMRKAQGRADPQVVRQVLRVELDQQKH